MAKIERIYQRTDAGCRALGSNDSDFPDHYRRILALMDTEKHSDEIRTALRRYQDWQIFDWLAELHTLGFIISEPVTSKHDLDFTGSFEAAELQGSKGA